MITKIPGQPKVGNYSPWGKIDGVDTIAEGIWVFSTPGHGGVKLSRKRQNEMPAIFRKQGGWYEEDCEAALVVLGLQRYFSQEKVVQAEKSVKDWFPDQYETWSGTVIPIHESRTKTKRKFDEDNYHNFVTISAYGDWQKNVPINMVGVVAKQNSTGIEKYFLVHKDEYQNRKTSFVINLDKHQEVEKFN